MNIHDLRQRVLSGQPVEAEDLLRYARECRAARNAAFERAKERARREHVDLDALFKKGREE